MWIPCFVSVLVLQLSAAMAASIIPNFPVGTCLTLQCSRGTACREVYDPQTQIITARCLRNVRPSDVCGAAGQPLYTIVNGTIMGAFCGRGFNRITCPPGYWCNIDPVDRFADCCPSSSLTKPGQCSSLPISMSQSCITECSNDRQCPGDQKCCVNGCNVLCTSPVIASTPSPGALTCANVLCAPGGYCVDTPAGPACRQETPVTSGPKPGQCPAIGADGPGICVSRLETCLSDSECLGSLKCCANACGGTVCVPPQTQTPRTCAYLVCTDGICEDSRDGPRCISYKVPAEKSGFCPPLPYTCTPSDPNAPYCLFPAECDTDFNCPGNKKCCATCIKCRECLRPNITDPLPTQTFCDKPCAPGHRCVDTGIRCRRAPCSTYQCVPIDPCSLPADSGLCLAAFPRYYYDASGPRSGCRTFIYGGCGGNKNNFLSLKDCLKTCGRNDDD